MFFGIFIYIVINSAFLYIQEQGSGACYNSVVNDVLWYRSSPAITNYDRRILSVVMSSLGQLDAGFSLQSLRFSPG
jgi:hypothetical protein